MDIKQAEKDYFTAFYGDYSDMIVVDCDPNNWILEPFYNSGKIVVFKDIPQSGDYSWS